jgi:uncharacterized membrane protein (DUF373 family)
MTYESEHVHKHTIEEDRLVSWLRKLIRVAVRALAVIMVVVIFYGVVDVLWVLYERLSTQPYGLLNITDILATFGAFMAVLIAIEIFENITVYLREDVIHVKIVMATALMAIARKVIVLDFKEIEPPYVFGLAAITLAMSIGYWLVVVYEQKLRIANNTPTVAEQPIDFKSQH